MVCGSTVTSVATTVPSTVRSIVSAARLVMGTAMLVHPHAKRTNDMYTFMLIEPNLRSNADDSAQYRPLKSRPWREECHASLRLHRSSRAPDPRVQAWTQEYLLQHWGNTPFFVVNSG